jgi:hypothetical protein
MKTALKAIISIFVKFFEENEIFFNTLFCWLFNFAIAKSLPVFRQNLSFGEQKETAGGID